MIRQLEVAVEEDAVQRPVMTRREVISIRETLDELAMARCPLCRDTLIARQGRRGPVFVCRCAKGARRRAS